MLKNGIAIALVDAIPDHIDAPQIKVSEKDLRRVLEVLPDNKPAVYSASVWDFSPCFKYTWGERTYIDFRRCPAGAEIAIRDYALQELEEGNKITTVSSLVANLTSCLTRIICANNTVFQLIEDKEIVSYIEGLNITFGTKFAYINNILRLYRVMTLNDLPHLVDIKKLEQFKRKIKSVAKHEISKHFKPIPHDYLSRMMTMFNSVMRDENKPFDQRMTAGLMLLETQLGLRASELVIMPKDCMGEQDTTHGKRPFIIYRSRKAARGSREIVAVQHIGTRLAFETLDYYLKLREHSPNAGKDILYVDLESKAYPLPQTTLRRRYCYLIKMYLPEAREHVDGVDEHRFRDGTIRSIPSIHCFRTTVFSAMADAGIPYPYIEKMMSHTPGAMSDDGYYGGIKKYDGDVWSKLEGNE